MDFCSGYGYSEMGYFWIKLLQEKKVKMLRKMKLFWDFKKVFKKYTMELRRW